MHPPPSSSSPLTLDHSPAAARDTQQFPCSKTHSTPCYPLPFRSPPHRRRLHPPGPTDSRVRVLLPDRRASSRSLDCRIAKPRLGARRASRIACSALASRRGTRGRGRAVFLSPRLAPVCVCVFVCVCLCLCACVRMHACMYACMYVCMYACMHARMYACMYVDAHMFVCMYICKGLRAEHYQFLSKRFALFLKETCVTLTPLQSTQPGNQARTSIALKCPALFFVLHLKHLYII